MKIEVPTDTPTKFELGDTAVDIWRRREEREQREEREREEARRAKTPQSTEEAVAKKKQELRGGKAKWTHKVEGRRGHLNRNPGTLRDI